MPPTPDRDSATRSFGVLGPGGVGGLLAGVLARDGHAVTCVAREETAARLRGHGLNLRSAALGDVTLGDGGIPFAATATLAEPVDACFVTVKAPHLDAALARVPPEHLGAGLVVPFLNGVEHVETLRRRYPSEQVVVATMAVEAYQDGPGVVVHSSPFARVVLARGKADDQRVEALGQHLERAGLTVEVRERETEVLWDKLRMLGPLALLTTLASAPVGVVRAERRDELVALFREYGAVARALGVPVDVDATLGFVDQIPGGMATSMQRDAAAGRPIEVEAIGGALLRAAGAVGVEVPTATRIVAALRATQAAR